MAAVRTSRLATGISGGANVNVTIYTCPPNRTAIVKDVRIVNAVGGSVNAIFSAQSGPGPSVFIFSATLPTPGSVTGGALYVVLEPGDVLRVQASVAGGVAFWVSGTELAGVAP